MRSHLLAAIAPFGATHISRRSAPSHITTRAITDRATTPSHHAIQGDAMPIALLTVFVHLQTAASQFERRLRADRLTSEQRDLGQATTEYALVLLAAALVGLLVVAWATAGGGAERVGRLFNRVIDSAIDRV
jgi:hypothetical protein